MKKISTATAGKSEKVEGQRVTVGLDLGERSSWYCILNEAGEVVLERRLATTPKAMKEVFGGITRSQNLLDLDPRPAFSWKAITLTIRSMSSR